MKTVKKNKKRGQGMTEYLIIVALIAIAAVVVIRKTSNSLQVGFGKVANALQGDTKTALKASTVSASDVKDEDMSNFNK